ncbi:hypothetical protein Tco_0564571 [Tanacetum coccineum]
MESSDQFICFFCGSLSDEYGCSCSTCELCGNDAHNGYDCLSQVPFVYSQDPCFNQNLDNFPQTSPKDEHLDTILKTDSDEEIESSVKNLNLTPSESEDLSDYDSDSLMEEIDIFLVADDSIPPGIDSDGYDSEEDNLFLEYEPDPGELTRVVVEDIFGEPKVHMPNVLPTHPTLCQNLDFTISTDFSGSDLVVSFPFRNRNKTFDPGISIEVQSKRFLSLNKFSISFISDPLSLVLETLLPSEIKDKVFNPGILVSKEEKSPHLLSHRGFKAFKIIHNFLNESPMMIYGGDMPILDDSPDYEDSRARGFVQRSLDLHSFACLFWESYILDLID